MPFPDIDPVIFQIGPFALRWYALAYVAGIALGWWYGVRLIKNQRIWDPISPPVNQAQVDDLILWLTLGVILGGRIGYVLFYRPDLIWEEPLQIPQIWNGGMSFHGGALGVAIAIVIYAWRQKIDLLRLSDLVAPCVPFGLFFGRVANFVNGELWGRTTDAPWGMVFCSPNLEKMHQGTCPAGLEPRHPSQLYEAALEGIVLFLILRWATHGGRLLPRRGLVTGLFLACYAVFRIAVETVREPDEHLRGMVQEVGLTMGMLLSVPMLLLGLFLIVQGMRRPAGAAQEGAAASRPAGE